MGTFPIFCILWSGQKFKELNFMDFRGNSEKESWSLPIGFRSGMVFRETLNLFIQKKVLFATGRVSCKCIQYS